MYVDQSFHLSYILISSSVEKEIEHVLQDPVVSDLSCIHLFLVLTFLPGIQVDIGRYDRIVFL